MLSGSTSPANCAGYDFVNRNLQYAGVQTVYNWDCCGLSLGYRRFALGSVRDETQYLGGNSFTIANFGSVGDTSASSQHRLPRYKSPPRLLTSRFYDVSLPLATNDYLGLAFESARPQSCEKLTDHSSVTSARL